MKKFDRYIKSFEDIDVGFIYYKFKKLSSLCIYDEQSYDSLKYLIDNIDCIKQDAVEVTIDNRDIKCLNLVNSNDFMPTYHWYIYSIIGNEYSIIDKNIIEIKDREKVRNLLTDQVHELASRMPSLFDENGEEEDWYKLGDYCLAYMHNNIITSVLTYTIEKDNIHIYLTYTVPEYRSSGYGSILIKYMKYFAMKNNIKTITVCTDVSENNRVPNMLNKNMFQYFKTGYEKIIRKK